jgi:hypothetical protein
MTSEEQLRGQRNALNTALNNRQVEVATSFLHPDFIAEGTDGHRYNRNDAARQLGQYMKPSMNFHSQIEVEDVEVSGDSAILRVRRTEGFRMNNPWALWGFLAAAAVLTWQMIKAVVSYGPELTEFTLIRYWGFWIGIGGGIFGILCFLVGAFCLGRRSMRQTQRAQETWRYVDGRWLLAEERQLA